MQELQAAADKWEQSIMAAANCRTLEHCYEAIKLRGSCLIIRSEMGGGGYKENQREKEFTAKAD